MTTNVVKLQKTGTHLRSTIFAKRVLMRTYSRQSIITYPGKQNLLNQNRNTGNVFQYFSVLFLAFQVYLFKVLSSKNSKPCVQDSGFACLQEHYQGKKNAQKPSQHSYQMMGRWKKETLHKPFKTFVTKKTSTSFMLTSLNVLQALKSPLSWRPMPRFCCILPENLSPT